MASENPYLGGDTVYGSGRSSPTSGTVDPMGYIERELNKPSQTRSGLAQAALSRLNGDTPSVPPQDPVTAPTNPGGPMGTTIEFTVSPTGQLIPLSKTPALHTTDVNTPVQSSPLALAAATRLGGQPNG